MASTWFPTYKCEICTALVQNGRRTKWVCGSDKERATLYDFWRATGHHVCTVCAFILCFEPRIKPYLEAGRRGWIK